MSGAARASELQVWDNFVLFSNIYNNSQHNIHTHNKNNNML